ncbi:MAG: TolC family protein [Gammaproteobacteria bacterium]|nr:TolC family protein [Gammaproteobacteria bacterium]
MQKLYFLFALLLGELLFSPGVAKAADINTNDLPRASLELTNFVQSVLEVNPRVQAARDALDASASYRDAASRPLYNPELSLDTESTDTDTQAISISQTLDWSGKRKARTTVAESNRLVVESDYITARWAVTVELLNGLALHQTAVEREKIAESRRQLMQEFSDLSQQRFDAGDLNQAELSLAKLASTEARIQKATSGAGLAEARQSVRNITPFSLNSVWPVLPTRLPVLPQTASDYQTVVLALPEVLAVRRQVESADAVVDLRRRERRPDPTVSLAGGREDGENLIGFNVTLPLAIRNRFKHEVTAAMAERSQTQQLANDVMQRAHARLISATEQYVLSRDAWQDWELGGQGSLDSQTEQLQKLWKYGELDTTDYLVQLHQTLDVQESALDLREALWRAWFEWLRASGQVDAWLGQGEYQ